VKVNEKLTIEVERRAKLRRDEYFIVSFDKEGNEVQGFAFYVDDKGMIERVGVPYNLTEGVPILIHRP